MQHVNICDVLTRSATQQVELSPLLLFFPAISFFLNAGFIISMSCVISIKEQYVSSMNIIYRYANTTIQYIKDTIAERDAHRISLKFRLPNLGQSTLLRKSLAHIHCFPQTEHHRVKVMQTGTALYMN